MDAGCTFSGDLFTESHTSVLTEYSIGGGILSSKDFPSTQRTALHGSGLHVADAPWAHQTHLCEM